MTAGSSNPGFHLLSSITVTFNSSRFVVPALESIQAASLKANLDLELIVIDNASSDDTVKVVAQHFPEATIVRNAENVGFSVANNQAFAIAKGDLWLLANPDATVELESIRSLADFLVSHPRAAAVAPSMDGQRGAGPESAGMSPGIRSMAGHFLFLNRLLPGTAGGAWQGWQLASRPRLGARRVDWVGGTVAALRPEAVRTVSGFDESFFLYFEDVDLGERLRQGGWELWLAPGAKAKHLISHGRISTSWLDVMHEYYGVRASRARLVIVGLIVAVGLAARGVSRTITSRTAAELVEARRARANARRAIQLLATSLSSNRRSR